MNNIIGSIWQAKPDLVSTLQILNVYEKYFEYSFIDNDSNQRISTGTRPINEFVSWLKTEYNRILTHKNANVVCDKCVTFCRQTC